MGSLISGLFGISGYVPSAPDCTIFINCGANRAIAEVSVVFYDGLPYDHFHKIAEEYGENYSADGNFKYGDYDCNICHWTDSVSKSSKHSEWEEEYTVYRFKMRNGIETNSPWAQKQKRKAERKKDRQEERERFRELNTQ